MLNVWDKLYQIEDGDLKVAIITRTAPDKDQKDLTWYFYTFHPIDSLLPADELADKGTFTVLSHELEREDLFETVEEACQAANKKLKDQIGSLQRQLDSLKAEKLRIIDIEKSYALKIGDTLYRIIGKGELRTATVIDIEEYFGETYYQYTFESVTQENIEDLKKKYAGLTVWKRDLDYEGFYRSKTQTKKAFLNHLESMITNDLNMGKDVASLRELLNKVQTI